MANIEVPNSNASAAARSQNRLILNQLNDLSAAINALTAKLDADAGVTDTNYAATIGAMDILQLRGTTL